MLKLKVNIKLNTENINKDIVANYTTWKPKSCGHETGGERRKIHYFIKLTTAMVVEWENGCFSILLKGRVESLLWHVPDFIFKYL